MKKTLLILSIIITTKTFAQIPEDVLRYSFFPQNGTARTLAIGGAMGSLGGDITSTFVNPAGLGNYKTGEVAFTPSYFLNNNKVDYRDTKSMFKKNNIGIGTIGMVFGTTSRYKPEISQAYSLAFTQTASFNNTVKYTGYNNYSSFAEQWSEEAVNLLANGDNINTIINNPYYAYGTSQALYTYLVDTFRVNDSTVAVKSMPEFLLSSGQALLQNKTVETRGGMYELSGGYAYNNKDKWLFGISAAIPIISYKNNTTFTESDTSNNSNNNFANFTYKDSFNTTGAGINLKLGFIYKPKEHIRLGFALHTPTYMFSMADKRTSSLTANTEAYNQTSSISSTTLPNGQPGQSKYTMLTPWKVMISGSYVFREVENVRKQKGFITADIEYQGYSNAAFYSANENPTDNEKAYFKDLTKVIKNQYKGAFNFRVGGELKFNIIMARLGFAYYMNPYKDAALKANRLLLSGGLGYRHKGFFVDVTYVHSFNKDVDFAYRLSDKANTFASLKNQHGNIAATIGIKF